MFEGWRTEEKAAYIDIVCYRNCGNQYCQTVLQTAGDTPYVAASRLRHEQYDNTCLVKSDIIHSRR